MIITKTPFRISFLGGGTDYYEWLVNHKGAVLATTIDKYCYIMVRWLPNTFDHKTRVVYRTEEFVDDNKDIAHKAINACLRFWHIDKGIEIVHWSDMPARKGMGSSSAFIVGLNNAIGELVDRPLKNSLALSDLSHYIEYHLMKENVGLQDSYLCSVGGFNKIVFQGTAQVQLSPLKKSDTCELKDYLMLFDTGIYRVASDVAKYQIVDIEKYKSKYEILYSLVNDGYKAIMENRIKDFGSILGYSWSVKRKLSPYITNDEVDEMYLQGCQAGAYGGKLLGAGGGGYMVFVVHPRDRDKVKEALGKEDVEFDFEEGGSKLIYKGSG